MLIQSFLKGIALLANWQVIIAVLLYGALAIGFTFLLGAIGLIAENKNRTGMQFGIGCLWQILGPLWQALLLAFLVGAITPIAMGYSNSIDIHYALSNLSTLWVAGLAGIVLLLILSIIPFINILIGSQDAGIFWIAIPIVISNFARTGFWGTLGLAYSFFWNNIFVMFLFTLFSFLIVTLGRFLTMGILYIISRFTDIESNVGATISMPLSLFLTVLFEFIPLFSFMFYFVQKYGTRAEDIKQNVEGGFPVLLGIIFLLGISFIVATGFYKLVEFFVKRRMKKRSVEIGTPIFHISMFKGLSITYVISIGLTLIIVLMMRASGNVNRSVEPLISYVIYGLLILWVTVLFQLYRVAKILKVSKVLAIRPSLIVILAAIAAYSYWFLTLILFIVVWIKANAYIHYEAQRQIE
ncbi:MAG: hypothetical protein PHQ96_05280 [Candidatus Omnitrophica bacterium]|nr:hypothetical protein [Candidatus Omnitrophota bacterium]